MKQDQRDQQHNRLIIVRPVCELQGRTKRMEDILGSTVEMLERNGTEIVWVVMASELKRISLVGERVLFAICQKPESIWNTTGFWNGFANILTA